MADPEAVVSRFIDEMPEVIGDLAVLRGQGPDRIQRATGHVMDAIRRSGLDGVVLYLRYIGDPDDSSEK